MITAFLRYENKILLVRRSEAVGTYRGRWSGISGYLENEPLEQAFLEILEETRLTRSDVRLVSKGKPVQVADQERGIEWTVYPFLFDIDDRDRIELDWENIEMRWVAPDEFNQYRTVPSLKAALDACLMSISRPNNDTGSS